MRDRRRPPDRGQADDPAFLPAPRHPLDALLKFRAQLNKQLAARGVKLSVNDFIIKACANALQEVPAANAVWAGDRMLKPQALRRRRGRGGRRRALHAGPEGRAPEIALGAVGGDEGPRHAGARPQACTARICRRLLRHLQPRHVRHRQFRRGHQPAPWRDPRRRRGREEAGRGRGWRALPWPPSCPSRFPSITGSSTARSGRNFCRRSSTISRTRW
jgi:hypothetical protein